MGYHTKEIVKGINGELSKIYEEVDELKDAVNQNATLMILLELSDIIGAIELYIENHHPSITLNDLIKMKDLTKSAFMTGERK